MEAASWLVEWIKGEIEGLISNVFEPIKRGIENYVKGVAAKLQSCVDEYQSTGTISSANINEAQRALLGPLADLLLALGEILGTIFNLISPFLEALEKLMDIVQDILLNLISQALGAISGDDYSSFFEGLDINNHDGIVDGIKTLLGINTAEDIALAVAIITIITTGLFLLLGKLGKIKIPFLDAFTSIYFAIMGLIFAVFSYVATSTVVQLLLILGGGIISGGSIILGKDGLKSANIYEKILSAVGVGLGIAGLVVTVVQWEKT